MSRYVLTHDEELPPHPDEMADRALEERDRLADHAPAPCPRCGGRGYTSQDSFGVYEQCDLCEDPGLQL